MQANVSLPAVAAPIEASHVALRFRNLLVGAAALAATAAWADYQSFAIEQVYSNADGTVQFVVLHETQGTNGGNNWSGRTLTSTHAGKPERTRTTGSERRSSRNKDKILCRRT